mgnify:FL=1
MKCLIKLFFAPSFFCISIVSSFANESEIKTISSAKADARKAIGEIYSCEYKITYSNLENQKAFSSDEVAKKNLPFIYTKTVNSVYQYADSPIINPSKNLNIKVDFDLKMDKKAYNIKITPSTSSTSLDKNIQNAFTIARFSTHKGFWWGDTLKFSDEIKLEKTGNCRIRNIYDENELLLWRKKLSF